MKNRHRALLVPLVALSALVFAGCRDGACGDDAQPAATEMPAETAG